MLPGSIPLPSVRLDRPRRQDFDEEPIDRLRLRGPRSLADSELLALLMRSQEPQAIRGFLDELGLVGLAQLDETLFYQSEWSEEQTAALLAAVELARRLARIRIPEGQVFERPALVAEYLILRYQGAQEVLGALYLDGPGRLITEREIFRGTLDRATADSRDVVKYALLCGAAHIIVFHNHPSGDPTPSQKDMAFTKHLAEACDVMGISLWDHLILGHAGRWVSLKARGLHELNKEYSTI